PHTHRSCRQRPPHPPPLPYTALYRSDEDPETGFGGEDLSGPIAHRRRHEHLHEAVGDLGGGVGVDFAGYPDDATECSQRVTLPRSEERRVGREWRGRWAPEM